MIWHTVVTALLAAGVSAGGIADLVSEGVLNGRRGRGASLERRMEHAAQNHHVIVTRQQAPNSVVLNQDGTINMTAWEEEVNIACIKALSMLKTATNPSGTCTCYNLPALNNETGTFEADLRLYQISAARDEFAGISSEKIQVGLTYNGASVSPVSSTTATQKVVVSPNARRQTAPTTPMTSSLTLLQTYLFVGQIDQNRVAAGLNMAVLEQLVTPTVTLSAINGTGATVSTNVSSNEAAFVAGVFSNELILSDAARAQIAVDTVVAQLKNGTVAFVLPGVNLLIFPIGLIITSAWFVIGLGVIGFGFFERVQYRENYRRRAAVAGKGQMGTI